MLLVRRVYHADPLRMTWRTFTAAYNNARAFILWEQGKAQNPADRAPAPPDAESLGL